MKIKVEKWPVSIPGFRFAGVASGIKPSSKKDLALIVSDVPAVAAAAFTTNKVKAAPVLIGQERVKSGRLQAIVINSGNANASTGEAGRQLAEAASAFVGQLLGIDERLVLPSSTGKIGVLPAWNKMRKGIREACAALSSRGFWDAAVSIMTTDSFPKATVRHIRLDHKPVTVVGMAKGAGMINPHMATMLCYVTTDACVARPLLREILDVTLADSFNAILVDGDTSTNDTVVLLANGLAGHREIKARGKDFGVLQKAIGDVLRELARLCVKDGEGATRVVDIFVHGAKNVADARRVARTVASSPLVKTAFFGGDPNWGRIACAVGYAGATMDQNKLDIMVGDVPIGRNGVSTGASNEKKAARIMQAPEFTITIGLNVGNGSAHVVTSDLSLNYVRFNSAYST